MASTATLVLFFLFFFFFLMQEATAETNESIIELGSWLSPKGPNTSWPTSSGRFAFGFYPHGGNNGFAVGIWLVTPPSPSDNTTTTVVWTANRDSPPLSSNSILNLTNQGLFLQYEGNNGGQYLTILDSDSNSKTMVALGSMNDNGNFVLYNDTTGNFVVWQSFDYPTDTILGGQKLTNGTKLVSSISISDHSSGRFCFLMQTDSLVAYPMNSVPTFWDIYFYWDSKTSQQHSSTQLSLNVQGSIFWTNAFYNATRKKSNINTTTSLIYRATVEPNGNFILYQHQFDSTGTHVKTILWQALNDTCQIKGYCGSNSYCSNFNKSIINADCQCFHGFTKTAATGGDCVQTHSNDDCESSEDPSKLYNITQFKNMTWGDVPYFVIQMKDQEACEKACRQDCDCGGALYQTDGNCRKYRLPIVYAARFQNADSSIALIKIPSPLPPTPNNTDLLLPKSIILPDNKTNLIVILSSTLGSISLIFLVFAVCVFITYRRQLRRYTTLSQSDQSLGFTQECCSLRAFSFDELVKSTENFAEEIGRGSFGAVYGGTILIGESNKRIAVKRLERINNNNANDEGEREFRAEVTAIARTHHRNLVKLIGFCIDGSKKLLVYEYLSNGSLASLLFEKGVRLCSKEKMKIALDVARGLLYLHEECEVRIIHCNIKPRNILMDEAWNAKITDFGLARLLKRECSRMKMGGEDNKSGYLAPEWNNDSSVSVKADIYSFGIVLLEIVCRRSSVNIKVSSAGEILLSSWAYQCFASGQLNKLITPNDHEEEEEDIVDWKVVERMVKVGLWCVQDHPTLRPSIKNVILMLEGLKDIPVPPSPSPSLASLVEI